MRLTCPSCGAKYDVPDGMLPGGGGHVQCTACHTRWFARSAARPAELMSEEQILAKLESRLAGPRPVPLPHGGASAPTFEGDPRHFDWEKSAAAGPDAAASLRRAEAAAPPAPPAAPERARPASSPTAEPPGRGRFAWGFLVGLGLVVLALIAYLGAAAVAARLPAAAPGLAAYVGWVDAARAWLAEIAPSG